MSHARQSSPEPPSRPTLRQIFEFLFAWLFIHALGILPRRAARAAGVAIARIAYAALARLCRVGLRNLELAFPAMPAAERSHILRQEYRNLGWLLAEFCQMSRYTPSFAGRFIRYEGLEH